MDAFDKYSQGKMGGEELNLFKRKLEDEPQFRDNYRFYKMIITKVQEEAALKESLKARFIQVEKRSRRFNLRRIFFSSAAVLLIAVALFTYKYSRSGNDYSKYMFEEPGLSIKMGSNTVNKWAAFSTGYADKKYEDCISILSAYQSNDTAIYYSGVCYEYLHKTDSATYYYNQLENSTNTILRQKSNYRKAIIMLRGSDRLQGLTLLKNIANDPTNQYNAKAKEVIKDISE